MKINSTKIFGQTWVYENNMWQTKVDQRFMPMVWQFGEIWQACIKIPHGSKYPNSDNFYKDLGVRIGLNPTNSCEQSMKKTIKWIENYQKNGPQSWAEICRNCYDNFPMLFKRESDVIRHVFFVVGNGYNWLDGCIINELPEEVSHKPHENISNVVENSISELDHFSEQLEGDLKDKLKNIVSYHKKEQENNLLEKETWRLPLQETKESIKFDFPGSGSNILHIPNDVTNEYLILCHRIWNMFRYENINKDVTNESKKELYEKFVARFQNRLSQI